VIVEGKISRRNGGRYGGSRFGMNLAFESYRGGRRYVSRNYSPWHLDDTDWLIKTLREVKNGEIIELSKELVLRSGHPCYVSPANSEYALKNRGDFVAAYAFAATSPRLSLLRLIAIAARPRYQM